jgi:1L-myo-inositol 1-phosphate cytidylyltransferase / CDP-L-myo-inositol myo-inositolphosphotransferase
VSGHSEAIAISELRPDVGAVIFVPNPAVWQRAGTPGGLALLERQLKQLRKLGDRAVLLLVPESHPAPTLPSGCGATSIVRVPAGTPDVFAALAATVNLPATFLALSADRLVDLRVLRALHGRNATTVATIQSMRPEPVAWIHAADVDRWGDAFVARAERLALSTLDPYSPELRGVAAPYVIASGTPDERRAAWDMLLDHVQKRSLDVPGQYFDTPFENFLVRRLAPCDVTPNQITLLSLLVAGGVGLLFSTGWLRLGVLLALVVGVLDGVDGKLARMKLATSKLGELEHVGDFFYENGWYLALASYLSRLPGHAGLWLAGWLLVACDLADSLLYLVVQRRTGQVLDELTPFDRRFRAIAGRRNVYVMMFVAGFFADRAPEAFACAVTWAVVTVAVHAVRAAWVVATVPPAVRTA